MQTTDADLAAELQRHEIDLWAGLDDPAKWEASLGPADERGARIQIYSWCKCGEKLDNDASDEGWPSMAKHLARVVRERESSS